MVLLTVSVLFILGACSQSDQSTANKSNKSDQTPKEYTAQDVIDVLKKEGLNIDKVVKYDEKTDTNELLGRPGQYIAKSNFSVKELETNDDSDIDVSEGGSVEIFANAKDAKARYDYISEVSKGMSILSEYDYLNGKILLRLSNSILPSKAKEYEKAFNSLK